MTCEPTEGMYNAHIFIWSELRRRKIPHNTIDDLDRKTSLVVQEYPAPEEGVPQQLEKIDLEEVLKAFPDIITIDDPIHVFLCGRIVNEKGIPVTHDLDILFKQSFFHQPTMNSFLQEVSKNNPEVAKRFHFVWDPDGPQIGYVVPLYKLAFIKIDPTEMQRTSPYEFLSSSPQLFKPHIGIKPMSGFEKYEFWDPVELWEKWGKNFIDKGIIVQKKYDGMRFQIHCKGNEVKIFTEDRQRDRADVFKKSVQELIKEKKADAFILDAEMVEYQCGKIQSKNLEEICDTLPREQMIKWIAAGAEKLDDSFIVFHVHDCTLLNNQPQNMKGYEERWNDIKKVFPDTLEHWRRIPGVKTGDPRSFAAAVKKYRSLRGSEGVVCKAVDSLYKIKYSGEARSREWAKLKNLKEIDVMVSEVVQKKSKTGKVLEQYLYECVFSIPCADADNYREKDLYKKDGKCYLNIGRSYATGEKVSVGSIIVIRPIRVGEYKDPKGKLYYTWMFPYFSGKHAAKTEPDGIDTVRKLVAESTGPSKKDLSKKVIFNLDTCPFWNDEKICILKERFAKPRDNLSKMTVEYLKFPIVCKFANNYKCRFVKSYYYGLKDFELSSETDEDTGATLNET